MGIASPAKWLCSDRGIVDIYIYPSGLVAVNAYGYDLDWESGGFGTGAVDASGRFIVQLDNGFSMSGKVSVSGSVRGSAVGPVCKYTFTALRERRAAYDPAP